MLSKERLHKIIENGQCLRKTRHHALEAAHAHVRELLAKGVYGTGAYRCPHCGFWHVGHPKTEQDFFSEVPSKKADNYQSQTRVYVGRQKVPYGKLRKNKKPSEVAS